MSIQKVHPFSQFPASVLFSLLVWMQSAPRSCFSPCWTELSRLSDEAMISTPKKLPNKVGPKPKGEARSRHETDGTFHDSITMVTHVVKEKRAAVRMKWPMKYRCRGKRREELVVVWGIWLGMIHPESLMNSRQGSGSFKPHPAMSAPDLACKLPIVGEASLG